MSPPMNTWIKFDADQPDEWLREAEILVQVVDGNLWFGKIPNDEDLFAIKGEGGDVILLDEITYFMKPAWPSDQMQTVSVPIELSDQDLAWLKGSFLSVYWYNVTEEREESRWASLVRYFSKKGMR